LSGSPFCFACGEQVESETKFINQVMGLQQLSDRDANRSTLLVPLQPLHWPSFPHLDMPVSLAPNAPVCNAGGL
jgi:hypothetical protein